ncbi:MAG TPA: nitroreductase/quinone reductase family protein [Phototrophicaceae bacterium]|nr:nitroreductase/quinone reductase family protein [Phototrophicaceae bacterium]
MASLTRLFIDFHVGMYRRTGGRFGGNLGGAHILLLTTTGRKSGQARTTPLRYLPHGDGYMVVGSNNGQPKPPNWFLNLQANPTVQLQVMDKQISARAEVASAQEHDALYQQFIDADKRFATYVQTSGRTIPVILLHPL